MPPKERAWPVIATRFITAARSMSAPTRKASLRFWTTTVGWPATWKSPR